jgi:hypothetical protein
MAVLKKARLNREDAKNAKEDKGEADTLLASSQ